MDAGRTCKTAGSEAMREMDFSAQKHNMNDQILLQLLRYVYSFTHTKHTGI